MRLFQTNQNLMIVSKAAFSIETPMGSYMCQFQEGNMSFPSKIEQTEKNALLMTWEEPAYRIECLRTPFQPVLASNMYVDECYAFIWRSLIKNKASISWKSLLDTSFLGSCETGENLISCIFEGEDTALSIGTEDEEKLVYRAENNLWMPNHLKDHITEKNILCLTNGLEIYFDQLVPGDCIQIHFLIAWSSKKEGGAISTWTAVEQSSNNLLKQAGFF